MTGQIQKVTTLRCIQFHSGLHGMKSNIYYHNNELIANVNILLELENDGIAYIEEHLKHENLFNYVKILFLCFTTLCNYFVS